jgi:hypothetical protein
MMSVDLYNHTEAEMSLLKMQELMDRGVRLQGSSP